MSQFTSVFPNRGRTGVRYEQKFDSLGDLASLFLCRAFQLPDLFTGPCRCQEYNLDSFVAHFLRRVRLEDNVFFGALLLIQRISFRSDNFIFKNLFGHKIFISAYILSAKELAREHGGTSQFLEDYTEWSSAAQGLFSGNRIQKMEGAALKVLQEDGGKGLQADTGFDGLLGRFRAVVVKDYQENWGSLPFPQSLATTRPVFLIHESDQEDGGTKKTVVMAASFLLPV